MTEAEYIAHIKLMLTGSVLHLELSDDTLKAILQTAVREVQRYIDQTKLMTIPYARCIDLNNSNVSSITAVYRTKGYMSSLDDVENAGDIDPFQAQMWRVFSNNGSMYNLQDYVMNYAAFATLLSMRSAQSTDLAYKFDKSANKLYINTSNDNPTSITIEYVPKFLNVEDITSDYWIEILQRLSVALTKQICGRVRTRYKQTNALWAQDGETLLAEANEELSVIRETLRANEQQFYPID